MLYKGHLGTPVATSDNNVMAVVLGVVAIADVPSAPSVVPKAYGVQWFRSNFYNAIGPQNNNNVTSK